MEQKLEAGQPISAPEYDPATDPVLAQLRNHSTGTGAGKWVFIGALAVAVVAIGVWYAYSVYESSSRQAVEQQLPPLVEAESAPPSPPPLSPRRRAEEWRNENLAATEFAGLPVSDLEDRGFVVIYTARSGDTIGAIVKRYGVGAAASERREILELAKSLHIEQYGGRGLWVGDDVRLRIPSEAGSQQAAIR